MMLNFVMNKQGLVSSTSLNITEGKLKQKYQDYSYENCTSPSTGLCYEKFNSYKLSKAINYVVVLVISFNMK